MSGRSSTSTSPGLTSQDGWSQVVWHTCPVCSGRTLDRFLAIERAPVFCNVQHPTREAALSAPTAAISLALCRSCELIANIEYDAARLEYAEGYENSLHLSGHFRDYAESLAGALIERYGIRNTDVIDIGCGQGEFLKLICRLGGNRGFGFDPSYKPGSNGSRGGERGADANVDVTIIAEPYGESLMTKAASLVCCRQVLEHIPNPLAFLRSIRKSVGNRGDTIAFFEVPNALWTIQELGIWDILYEHCTYFTPTALSNVFLQAGFKPLRVETTYGEQYLTIESSLASASAAPQLEAASAEVRAAVKQFQSAYEISVNTWKQRLSRMRAAGKTVVLWGAGTKGVMFLNTLGVSVDVVPCAVDVNPKKHGRFLAGTGQEIVAPEALRTIKPDVVIVMNPLYVDEITTALENLDLIPTVVTV
jgi:SAM-dependent methyltransferase